MSATLQSMSDAVEVEALGHRGQTDAQRAKLPPEMLRIREDRQIALDAAVKFMKWAVKNEARIRALFEKRGTA